MSTRVRCYVLLSGGIDSAACLQFYRRMESKITGIHISYGQPAESRERKAASVIAKHFDIHIKNLSLEGASKKRSGEILARNAFLITTAITEVRDSKAIVALGIHSGTNYRDCTPAFMSAIQNVIDIQCDGRMVLEAPFLTWTKREIWDFCIMHNVPVQDTYSCEKGFEQPCGSCLSCADREKLEC